MNKLISAALLAITIGTLLFSAHQKSGGDPHFPAEVVQAFANWQSIQNKIYSSPQEKIYRLSVFAERLAHIKAHNAKVGITYTQGLNKFSDMTFEEFTVKHTGDLTDNQFKSLGEMTTQQDTFLEQQAGVDWSTVSGAVNKVQDQGQCGGCWSFAATASFETAYFQKKKTLLKFSEQALIDCDQQDNGCGGGSPDTAMNYLTKGKGTTLLSDYPYLAKDGACKITTQTKVYKVAKYSYTAPSSAALLKSAVT